ncbi:MAG: hypothetical protein M5U26_30295 [Planctomycetota bacterium]|nr:hypothetical protein [Planctomycetota bacterium]
MSPALYLAMSEPMLASGAPTASSWPREMWRLIFRHPWLLAGTILPSILAPIVEPAQAWVAKFAVDSMTKEGATFSREELLRFVPWAVAVFLALAVIKLLGTFVDKMFDERLKIELQRAYFDRRPNKDPGEDIARTLNDAEQARKVADIVQRDIWLVVVGLPAVLLWQMKLAPNWISALLLAAAPSLLLTVLLGRFVQRLSHRRLKAMAAISDAVNRDHRADLHSEQEAYYRASVGFELCKKGTEVLTESLQWLGLIAVLLLATVFPLLPEEVSAGELAAFLVNLKLIGKPLNQIGVMYVKFREAQPALVRIFHPERTRVQELVA